MMYLMRMLASLLLAALMTACGGGGGSPGTVTTGGGANATPTITMDLVDAAGAPVSTVAGSGSFLRATVRDVSGAAVAGTVVTFTADGDVVGFVPASATALTDASGVATIQVSPASASAAGATTITANATVAGKAAKPGTLGVQVAAGSGGTSDAPMPASVELFSSSSQLQSSPASTVTFTVSVKDAQNRAMPNQTVTFTANSGNLVGALPAPTTGASGQPVTGVSLTPGGDRSNRDILVTATAGSIKQTMTVVVTGTTLSLVGDSSVRLGGTTTFTVTARDASGSPVTGAALTATSSLGNTLTPAQLVTDALGTARLTYRAGNAGTDTVTVRGLGASASAAVAISAEDFAFEAPVANSSVEIGPAQTVTVRLLSGGAPVAGRTVTFSTTRGAVSAATAVTDATGRASTTVSSTNSGPATIVARAGTAQTALPLNFLATVADTLVLQANPGAVPPNPVGSSTNQITLQAAVRDPAGNPVAGKVVNFSVTQDLSNGTISPGSGLTDANGIVSVQFIPGALSTGNNGVVIAANVQGTSVSASTALTVSGQALFISIGKGRFISQRDEPVYKKQFSVYVTDANGAAVPNKQVSLSVLPEFYRKGYMELPDVQVALKWRPVMTTALPCTNEDSDRDGILDAGEDFNGNGKLDPGLPVVITPATVTTDAGGFATFFLEYGKNFALWVDTMITARASAGGTESVQTQRWGLEIMEEDVSTAGGPPNQVSPFGTATVCSNPN